MFFFRFFSLPVFTLSLPERHYRECTYVCVSEYARPPPHRRPHQTKPRRRRTVATALPPPMTPAVRSLRAAGVFIPQNACGGHRARLPRRGGGILIDRTAAAAVTVTAARAVQTAHALPPRPRARRFAANPSTKKCPATRRASARKEIAPTEGRATGVRRPPSYSACYACARSVCASVCQASFSRSPSTPPSAPRLKIAVVSSYFTPETRLSPTI